jgi:hypothetical protein
MHMIWDAMLALLFLAASALQETSSRRMKIVLTVSLAGCLFFANSKTMIELFGMLRGKIQTQADAQASEAGKLKPTPEHPLLVDASSARYVFGYKLPTGTRDWSFGAPFPLMLTVDTNLLAGDIYLLGPSSITTLQLRGYVDWQSPKWAPGGLHKWSYYIQPRNAYIIRAEDCIAFRANPHYSNVGH